MALTKIKTNGIAAEAVTTAKIADGACTGSKIPTDAVGSNEIQDDAVTLAKMASGTDGQIITYDASGNPVAVGPGTDGQVLTSTGAGSPPAFESISIPAGTTINNNADNRVITGSGTANTLEGEANLTFDGNDVTQTIDADGEGFNQTAAGDHGIKNLVTSNRSSAGNVILHAAAKWNTTEVAGIKFTAGADTSNKDDGRILFETSTGGDVQERARIDEYGNAVWHQGHLGSMGGGVIVAAASSSSGNSSDSPNFKVDFTVPCGNVSNNHLVELQRGFDTGETGKDAGLDRGGSGILIATVICTYYIGFATKIYHLTNWGNGTDTNCSLDQLHSYTGSGHSSAAAAISLAVQSIDHSTPTLRCTFGGDYWNSNKMTVTWLSAAVSSPSMIRPNAMTDTNWGHAKWTGQDPTWK